MSKDKLKDSIKKTKIILIITNLAACICFLIAYFYLKNIWFLILVIVLILSSFLEIIFLRKFENKLLSIQKSEDKTINV
jgi:CDP-diglyceride synthetase